MTMLLIQKIPFEFNDHEFELKNSHTLNQMIYPEDLKHVTHLMTNYFDPSTWRELAQAGATNHHQQLLSEKITPGHLWVQKGLEGAIVHWSEGKTIHRASLFNEEGLITSFSMVDGKAQIIKSKTEVNTIKQVLHLYLQKGGDPYPAQEQSDWDCFRQKLELISITCKISLSASTKLNELAALSSNQHLCLSAPLIPQKGGKVFYQLIKSQLPAKFERAIQSRLQKHKSTYLQIGPTLNSFGALQQLEERIFPPDLPRVNCSPSRKQTTRIPKISTLIPSLSLQVGHKVEHIPFAMEILPSPNGKSGFELSLDHRKDQWILQSSYLEATQGWYRAKYV